MNLDRAGEKWTDEEIEILKKLYKEGLSDQEIAKELKRTEKSIKVKRVREGLVEKYSKKRTNHNGYIEVYKPNHHRARGNGYVFEHILVAENKLGRKITRKECVHHLDGDKKNNSPDNLKIMTLGEHTKNHVSKRESNKVELVCPVCKTKFKVKPSHVESRTTCSVKCAGELFRKYYSGKPKDHKISEKEKVEVINNVKQGSVNR